MVRSEHFYQTRRGARRLAHLQAGFWSAGNALTSGTPIYFLALELGAKNTQVGFLLALPTLLGLVRLATPAVIRRCGGDLRRACLILFSASLLFAFALPFVAWTPASRTYFSPLTLLVLFLCLQQTLEYLALVALFSWLGEIAPARIRGRYLGARQFWQLSVEIPAILLSGYFIDWWGRTHPDAKTMGYAIALFAGVVCLLLAIVVLGRMPRQKQRFEQTQAPGWRETLAPLRDASFWRLLTYGCWFSIFNGLTAAPQTSYPRQTLGLGVGDINAMRTGMRLGQFALSRPLGILCDRFGNRRVMLVSQLCVAAAPLCFLIATPGSTYWIFVAYLLWSWYVGLNIGLPNWMLRHAPRGESPAYLSAYFGVTGVGYAVAAIVGGYLLDQLIARWGGGPLVGSWNLYHLTFLFAWVTRSLGALLLARVPEASSTGPEMR